ncbi:MAG TPA: hypothetical protein VGB75_01060 [Jatrophihabitans sp.]|jgi:transcription elongation GreA/GreB family factor|uniref:hypothetical protein n=1 Tax=Jatrophihabitans sp. TaxID=1932789 RepID=UPI002EFC0EF9
MAELPRPHREDAAATALRARSMREEARGARERNQQLLRANEEMRARLRAHRTPAPQPEADDG